MAAAARIMPLELQGRRNGLAVAVTPFEQPK